MLKLLKLLFLAFVFVFGLLVIMNDAEGQTIDKKFVVTTGVTLGSAAFDAWSTNRNLDRGYRETNILMGEHPSSARVWATTMGEASAFSLLAYIVKKKAPHSKIWMFFPAISFGGHMYGGINNVAIYDPIKYPKVKR